ncbi:hypothetical protein ABZX51_000002 [Aspergillus tubingensis]
MHALSAHLFTICSLPSVKPDEPSQLIFYIRHQGGFTARLYEYALADPGATVSVLVDGPYGGINMQSYIRSNNLLLIAGGSGIGWTLPFIQQFLTSRSSTRADDVEYGQDIEIADDSKAAGHNNHNNISAPRSLQIILAISDNDSHLWFNQAINQLLDEFSVPGTLLNLHIQVHLTGDINSQLMGQPAPAESKEQGPLPDDVNSQSNQATSLTVAESCKDQPQLPAIIQEAVHTSKSLRVYICGPTSMQNDIHNAVADANLKILKGSRSGEIYLHYKHFQWA